MIRVPDEALEITERTVTIHLTNVPVVDSFTFYDPFPPSGHVPAVASFQMTYVKSGAPRHVTPTSTDPTSPFNWAGEMWMATGSVRFSVAYKDGSFSVSGTANSAGMFGELGTERNGFFVQRDGEKDPDC
jgi:hypothetical protein